MLIFRSVKKKKKYKSDPGFCGVTQCPHVTRKSLAVVMINNLAFCIESLETLSVLFLFDETFPI